MTTRPARRLVITALGALALHALGASGELRAQSLPLDPVAFSTLIGDDRFDEIKDLAVDASGRVVVTGRTNSADFPTTPGAFQERPAGNLDAFVARFSADGSRLEWSTLLGGFGDDEGLAVDVSPSGQILVAGITRSLDFPTTSGAVQPDWGGGLRDGFVVALSETGDVLEWGTYLGGAQVDDCHDLLAGSDGSIHVVGQTSSPDFPVTPGALDTVLGGDRTFDAFVTRIASDGSELVWSTFLGGSQGDTARALARHAEDLFVTGSTHSDDFPVTPGAFDEVLGAAGAFGGDVFVARLDETGSLLRWATYLGGDGGDEGNDIVIASDGGAIVTGTAGAGFPTTPGAPDTSSAGHDVFVTKLRTDGSTLAFSTYLSGRAEEQAFAVDLDSRGNVVVGGRTFSDDYPLTVDVPGWTPTLGDGFVTVLDPSGTNILLSKPLGGTDGGDLVWDIEVAPSGAVVLGGRSLATDFPTTPGAYQEGHRGLVDGFVVKLDTGLSVPDRCPRTQGFWKTHPDVWPVGELRLGDDAYTADELLELLWTRPRGDASLILAHQLIAAELNLAARVDGSEVQDAIAAAHSLLDRPRRLPHDVPASSDEGRAMTSVAEILADFNEGDFTGECEEIDPGGPARPSDRFRGPDLRVRGVLDASHPRRR